MIKRIFIGENADELPKTFAPITTPDDGAEYEAYARKMAAGRLDAGTAKALLEGLKMRKCDDLKELLKKSIR